MVQYRASSYNYSIAEGRAVVLHNFLTKALIEVPASSRDVIEALLHDPDANGSLDRDLFLLLLSQGFIIRSDINELDSIRYRYYASLLGGSNRTLRLAILPTMWCNFRCPYCFETRRHEFMQQETQSKLLEFADYKLTYAKALCVAWFGGEPLLCKATIESLTKGFQQICASRHCAYEAGITTNGYLLDLDFIKSLEGMGVRSLQITFDGPPRHHDNYRALPDGTGTFAIIQKNAEDLCRLTPDDFHLLIRVNCSQNNLEEIPELLNLFSDQFRKKAKIFFRWIYPNESSGFKDFACGIPNHSKFTFLANLCQKATEVGWSVDSSVDSAPIYCEVDSTNFFQISPKGDVFLCSDSYKPEESIGNVHEWRKLVTPDFKWYAANPFGDPDCLKCILLPYCMGGCRRARVLGHKSCVYELNDIDSHVRVLYQSALKQHVTT